MKQYFFSTVIFGLMVLMTACSNDDTPARRSADVSNPKTVLIYMAGRNSLESDVNADLREIKIGSRQIGEKNNLLVFVRRSIHEMPWLARIKNGEVTDSLSLKDLGIVSSDGENRASDPVVMEGVMRYAFSHYPATNGNYGLVLWGHGSGWLMEDEVKRSNRAYALDKGNRNDNGLWINFTTMAGIFKGLPHMKFIMGDCCNLMCLETLYELRTSCDYIIGSPAEIPANGAPYDKIVPDLFADGKFYTNIIDKYVASVNGNLPLTAVKTSEMDRLAQATRQALQPIKEKLAGEYADLTGLIHYYHTGKQGKFYPEFNIFYDAGDFIRTYAPADVYQQWRQALNRAILDTHMATRWSTDKSWSQKYVDFTVTKEKYHGVSLFITQDPARGNYISYNEDIKKFAWYNVVGSI